ncbi:hypothetical protein RvY_07168 [Ramazzottius varieornatus]|uniref:Uncharacterized protein n=1 Tax=Ramazzottius varieornatus TaxID=947166 RepID=A0A1D1V146_RAMVA|nr:hypothetical protein RvY_07168 [Ramazzottius varieornatus]
MDPVNPFNILKLLQSDYEQHFQLSDPPSEFDRMLKTFIKVYDAAMLTLSLMAMFVFRCRGSGSAFEGVTLINETTEDVDIEVQLLDSGRSSYIEFGEKRSFGVRERILNCCYGVIKDGRILKHSVPDREPILNDDGRPCGTSYFGKGGTLYFQADAVKASVKLWLTEASGQTVWYLIRMPTFIKLKKIVVGPNTITFKRKSDEPRPCVREERPWEQVKEEEFYFVSTREEVGAEINFGINPEASEGVVVEVECKRG